MKKAPEREISMERAYQISYSKASFHASEISYSNAEFPHLQADLPAYEIAYLLEIAFLRLCLHSEIAYFPSDYSDCLGRDVVPVDGIEVKEEKKNDNTWMLKL